MSSDDQDDQSSWKVKPEINYGNVLTLVSMIVAIVVGYTKLENRVDVMMTELKSNTSRDDALLTQFNNLRDLSFNRQETISNKLTRIESVLERVEKHQAPR